MLDVIFITDPGPAQHPGKGAQWGRMLREALVWLDDSLLIPTYQCVEETWFLKKDAVQRAWFVVPFHSTQGSPFRSYRTEVGTVRSKVHLKVGTSPLFPPKAVNSFVHCLNTSLCHGSGVFFPASNWNLQSLELMVIFPLCACCVCVCVSNPVLKGTLESFHFYLASLCYNCRLPVLWFTVLTYLLSSDTSMTQQKCLPVARGPM